MSVIERDLGPEWPKRLYPHGGGREWSTSDHGDTWKQDAACEVVPHATLQGAVDALWAASEALYLASSWVPDRARNEALRLAAQRARTAARGQ